MKRVIVLSMIMVIVAIYLVGCGQKESSENAAKMWINALLQKNSSEFSKRTCSRLQGGVEEGLKIGDDTRPIMPFVIGLGYNVIDEKCPGSSPQEKLIKYDTSQLQFTVLSEEGDKAQVKVSGQLMMVCATSNVTVGPSDRELGQIWQMIREDGIWKWCGAK